MNNGGQNQSVPSCVHRGGQGEATADSNCGSFHRVSFHREAPGQSVTQHLNRSKHTSTLTCLRFRKTKGKGENGKHETKYLHQYKSLHETKRAARIVLTLSLKTPRIIKFGAHISFTLVSSRIWLFFSFRPSQSTLFFF